MQLVNDVEKQQQQKQSVNYSIKIAFSTARFQTLSSHRHSPLDSSIVAM